MKVDVYNQKGEVSGSVNLPKEIFDVKFNADLVHQIVVSLASNSRQTSAHTKNRAEVRGGGRKPWRQKGTGRARHGSIRSPLWKGGGVTHGPRKERVFEKDIPKKMRRKALFMVLAQKLKDKQLLILDRVETENSKTKEVADFLQKLPCKDQSRLVATPDYNKKTFLATRNIKKTAIKEARNLNVLDLLNYKYLLMPKSAIKTLQETFVKE